MKPKSGKPVKIEDINWKKSSAGYSFGDGKRYYVPIKTPICKSTGDLLLYIISTQSK